MQLTGTLTINLPRKAIYISRLAFGVVLLSALFFVSPQAAKAQGTSSILTPGDSTANAANTPNVIKLQFEKASNFEKAGKYTSAIEYYTYCIDQAPVNSDAYKFASCRRASCYVRTKQYDLALHDAQNTTKTVIKSLVMVASGDAVRLSMQYDHDAYILTGFCKVLTKQAASSCGDFINAKKLEDMPGYRGDKNAASFIVKYCKK